MEDKQLIVDNLRKERDATVGPMRQYRNRHMKVAIKAKLLHWLLHTYFEHCFSLHGTQGRHIDFMETEL